jgi:hypothetical protein
MRDLRKLSYRVSYTRADGTSSPYGVASSYAASIKTKLTAIALDYYRIASADVQSMAMQGALLSASAYIESVLGLVLIPKDIAIDFTRFPVYDRSFEIPRGPLLITEDNPATLRYTQTQDVPYGVSTAFTVDDDASDENTVCRLMTDVYVPYFTIVSGQIWPVPLWSEPFPVRFSAQYGLFNPTVWAASTAEECYIAYAQPLTALLQLALHLYENRMPVNIGNIVSDIPKTLMAMIRSLKR